MALKKSYLQRSSYMYLGEEREGSFTSDTQFEFDEADLWNSTPPISPEPKKSVPPKKPARKGSAIDRRPVAAATSLPLNVPDWSKILRDEYNKSRRRESDGDYEDSYDQDDRWPPHEYLARTRAASFSVHEGIGRTLKGRDMSRVRNAIWKQTGFED